MQKSCERCGQEFTAQRPTARYCREACRVAAHRASRRQQHQDVADVDPVFAAAALRYYKSAQRTLQAAKALAEAWGTPSRYGGTDVLQTLQRILQCAPAGRLAESGKDPKNALAVTYRNQYIGAM
jgi:hypothetical protein